MGEELYAAATSANAVGAEAKFAAQQPQAGRPEQHEEGGDEGEESDGDSATSTEGGTKLQIANTKDSAGEQPAEHKMAIANLPMPAQASFIYKVTKEGFVTYIFN